MQSDIFSFNDLSFLTPWIFSFGGFGGRGCRTLANRILSLDPELILFILNQLMRCDLKLLDGLFVDSHPSCTSGETSLHMVASYRGATILCWGLPCDNRMISVHLFDLRVLRGSWGICWRKGTWDWGCLELVTSLMNSQQGMNATTESLNLWI